MNKQLITILLILTGISALFSQTKPNVIIVITDDQGLGEVTVYGNNIIQTPNMDSLHNQSVRLTNFHVDPTCSPSRAALLTGHYSRRAGVWHTIAGRSILRHDQISIADVLGTNGYRTGMFGKWHLGDNYPSRPEDKGFQTVFAHKGGGVGQGPDYFGNDYGQYDNNTSRDSYFRNSVPETVDGYCTDVWFAEAIKFMEVDKTKPFFVYLSTNAPHGPDNVDSKYSTKYEGQGVNAKFYGMIDNIDENLGTLMNYINTAGILDNTILIFMTDNGSRTANDFNAGLRAGKGSEYDGGHRVPFFIRWPDGNLIHQSDISQLTAHIDIFPTVLGLTGIQAPAGLSFDGIDISQWLKGSRVAWPNRTIMVESQRIQTPVKHRKTAVMNGNWRLVNNSTLYDMSNDRDQNAPVTDASMMAQLRADYDTWWNDVSSRDGEYVDLIVGHRAENPTRLMSHDWHPNSGETTPWNQSHVNSGGTGTGWYSILVAQTGTYKVSLRRWPEERPGPLEFGNNARLKIGTQEWTQAFNANNDQVVEFEMDLDSGSTRLESWLTDTRGTYYVYVQRLTGCTDPQYAEYDSTATVNDPTLCKTLPVNKFLLKNQKIFLAKNMLTVNLPESFSVSIKDISGKVIFRYSGKNFTQIPIQKMNPGIFIVDLKTGKSVTSYKFSLL